MSISILGGAFILIFATFTIYCFIDWNKKRQVDKEIEKRRKRRMGQY